MAPRSAKMAPKRPPNAAKMAIFFRFWELLGSIFDDLGGFMAVRLNIKNPSKTNCFSMFFDDLGSRMEDISAKI